MSTMTTTPRPMTDAEAAEAAEELSNRIGLLIDEYEGFWPGLITGAGASPEAVFAFRDETLYEWEAVVSVGHLLRLAMSTLNRVASDLREAGETS